ncbi:MAG: DNA cytosine methyltransferase [candidate division SR1 bacterium]|nr:DNA cytosine methyltransferase [candidate division SR1 bacterium]
MEKQLTVADFFCGAGGFSEGFRQKGFKIAFGLDNWKPAIETHDLNHPGVKTTYMNILELNTIEKIDEIIPDTDIIVGSPPCVSFSYSNKAGKADKSLGIQLIEQYLRIVLRKKKKGTLKYRIMENVPNSKDYVKDVYTWEELGLPGKGPSLKIPQRHILLASDYGAPQNRKRFVCGDYPVPEKTHEGKEVLVKTVMDCIKNPLDGKGTNEITDPIYGFTIPKLQLTDHFYDTTISEHDWKRAKRLKEDHGFMGKMDFPERTNRTCRTVTATQSASTRESIIFGADKNKEGKWTSYRLPTIREISCFMGFPINYQFTGGNESTKYKLVGNAVCPPMSAALAGAILKKEGLKNPKFIKNKDTKAGIDLTGRKTNAKKQAPKKIDSNYSRHIPYLKVANLRVELSNKTSDFEKGKHRWESTLHRGSGKSAQSKQIKESVIEEKMREKKEFQIFIKELETTFKKNLFSSKEMQERYCLLSNSSHFHPDQLLEYIKEMLDKFFPENKFNKVLIDNKNIINGKSNFPIRVLAGLYALNLAVSKLK